MSEKPPTEQAITSFPQPLAHPRALEALLLAASPYPPRRRSRKPGKPEAPVLSLPLPEPDPVPGVGAAS